MPGRPFVLVALVGLALVGSVAASQRAVPAANLVQNPGGEGVAGAVDTANQVLPRGWEIDRVPPSTPAGRLGFTVAAYGTHDFFPSKAVAAAIGGGSNFFAGGNTPPPRVALVTSATQMIDVGGAASEIDARSVRACLTGYLGGSRALKDSAHVDLEFLSADEDVLGRTRIGPVTPVHRKNQTTLLRRATQSAVPPNTRKLRVTITTQRGGAAGYVFGFADNVVAALTQGGCDPVLSVRCVGGALVATVTPSSVARVNRVRFAVKGATGNRVVNDARAPYSARFTMAGYSGQLTVTATVSSVGTGPLVLTRKSRRC